MEYSYFHLRSQYEKQSKSYCTEDFCITLMYDTDNPILQNIPTCVCRTKMKYAILKDHKTLWPYCILLVGVNTEI